MRDVLVLSTNHTVRFVVITKRGKVVRRPQIVLEYNKAKGGVEVWLLIQPHCVNLSGGTKRLQ